MSYIIDYIIKKIDEYGEKAYVEGSKPYRVFFDIRNIVQQSDDSSWIKISDKTPIEYHTSIRDYANLGTTSDPVLVTFIDKDVYNKIKDPYDGDRVVKLCTFTNGNPNASEVITDKLIAIAWMPKMDPYKGDI